MNRLYPHSRANAYTEIRSYLQGAGFTWVEGSVYFGDADIDAVKCVTVVNNLCIQFDWFPDCVRDIRMLRIEENNDLMPIVEKHKT